MKITVFSAILIMVSLFLVLGCSSTPQVQNGDTVKVNYKGTLEDGTVFDSSEGREPLQFVVGGGNMIKGFDEGVVGMVIGEKKTITLSPEDAYGYPSEDRIMEVEKSNFPADLELEVGMELAGPGGMPVKVKEIQEDFVVIDANHPMAGKTLIFELEIMEIIPAEATAEGEGQ
jgi:peptidylprolyl isomerase